MFCFLALPPVKCSLGWLVVVLPCFLFVVNFGLWVALLLFLSLVCSRSCFCLLAIAQLLLSWSWSWCGNCCHSLCCSSCETIRGQKLNTNFFSQTFWPPPGYPSKISGYPAKKVWFSLVSRDIRTFWPPPLHVEDPYPTGTYPDSKVWVCALFSCLTWISWARTCTASLRFPPELHTVWEITWGDLWSPGTKPRRPFTLQMSTLKVDNITDSTCRAECTFHLGTFRRPQPTVLSQSTAVQMGGVLSCRWEVHCSTNGRCTVGFPFLQGLEATKVQRYKWGAYFRTNWRCTAILSSRPARVGVSDTLLIHRGTMDCSRYLANAISGRPSERDRVPRDW